MTKQLFKGTRKKSTQISKPVIYKTRKKKKKQKQKLDLCQYLQMTE